MGNIGICVYKRYILNIYIIVYINEYINNS